jgi:fructokinase
VAEIVVGVDLGGTKIEAVIARREGSLGDPIAPPTVTVLHRTRVPTRADVGYEAVVEALRALLVDVASAPLPLAALDLASVPIGVGMPGGLTRVGLVKNANAVCLNGRPFRADVERAIGRPVAWENDANCFALAESLMGAARDHADGVVFGAILGSGVGGGIVVRGAIWPGAQGIAGEWGHHRLMSGDDARGCYCGARGCLERYLAGPAVEDAYAERARVRRPLAAIEARRATDPDAAAVIEEMLDAFGVGVANLIAMLDPSAIVLGGGVSNLGCLYDEGRARVARRVFNETLETPILRNALGDSAGVLGAALLAR